MAQTELNISSTRRITHTTPATASTTSDKQFSVPWTRHWRVLEMGLVWPMDLRKSMCAGNMSKASNGWRVEEFGITEPLLRMCWSFVSWEARHQEHSAGVLSHVITVQVWDSRYRVNTCYGYMAKGNLTKIHLFH